MSTDAFPARTQISKKRERFRSGSAKVVTALFKAVDRLEALAATQSYEIINADLDEMKAAVDERISDAFDALHAAAARKQKTKPATAPFSFGKTGGAQ